MVERPDGIGTVRQLPAGLTARRHVAISQPELEGLLVKRHERRRPPRSSCPRRPHSTGPSHPDWRNWVRLEADGRHL